MLLAFGWAIIQTSVFPYKNVRPDEFDELEKIDHQIQEADKVLHAECRAWLEENAGNWLIWQFIEHLNNHSGLLQFSVSRNHRTSMIWPLMDFIAAQSQGSYGAVYVHDDEDGPEGAGMYKVHPDRPPVDHARSFRVWRILDGQITEHEDTLFSPFTSSHAFEGNAPSG